MYVYITVGCITNGRISFLIEVVFTLIEILSDTKASPGRISEILITILFLNGEKELELFVGHIQKLV